MDAGTLLCRWNHTVNPIGMSFFSSCLTCPFIFHSTCKKAFFFWAVSSLLRCLRIEGWINLNASILMLSSWMITKTPEKRWRFCSLDSSFEEERERNILIFFSLASFPMSFIGVWRRKRGILKITYNTRLTAWRLSFFFSYFCSCSMLINNLQKVIQNKVNQTLALLTRNFFRVLIKL